jgi:hypothetical protein
MLELIFLFLPGNIDKSTEYLCKIWRFHVGDYEVCRPVTQMIAALSSSEMSVFKTATRH